METRIRQLNEELRDFREKVEDLEDNLEVQRKKYSKLRKEKDDLEEKLENLHCEFKRKQLEYDCVSQTLSDFQSKYELQREAMDFITEVLTAKHVSDESVDNLYKEVDSTVDFIKDEVRDILKQQNAFSLEVDQRFFGQDLYSWAVAKKKIWIQGKKTIAFVGEFSAGKTSIVNRILSQDNPDITLLPVSMKATTAVPTYISGGVGTYYTFVTPDNELKMISPSTFMLVNKDVLDKVKGVSSMIQYFVMTYKNPYLEKMSILDTPGFSSNDLDDENRTIDVINECDALFWVFDVNAGTINQTSLKVIKNNLVKPLYIVINKVDTKSKIDVDKVEALIRKTLVDEDVAFKGVVRFSSEEPLAVIMNAIDEISHDDRRESYMDNLIEYIKKLLKESVDMTNKYFSQYNTFRSEKEKLAKLFISELCRLESDCDHLSEMPKENVRIFAKNDYRIDRQQYYRFMNLIEKISEERTNKLRKLYENQKEAVAALETAWNKYSDEKKLQASLRKCLDVLVWKERLCSNKKVDIRCSPTKMPEIVHQEKSLSVLMAENKLKIDNLEHVFRWSIIEEKGERCKVNWETFYETLNSLMGTTLTKKRVKELIPTFGYKRPVYKYDLFEQIKYIIATTKTK